VGQTCGPLLVEAMKAARQWCGWKPSGMIYAECSTVRYAQVRQAGVPPMPRTCSCVIALTAMLVGLSTARAAEPATLTLACQGTTTDAMQPDAKPQQITMGVVINFSVRTVAGFTSPGLEEFPVVIRDANEVLITFAGSNESGSSRGT